MRKGNKMTKKNIEKLQIMAQDFLQYRYRIFCTGRRDADWNYYQGACDMIQAFGGEWKRVYTGKDHGSEDELNNLDNYYHIVWFPSKEKIERLNEDVWK